MPYLRAVPSKLHSTMSPKEREKGNVEARQMWFWWNAVHVSLVLLELVIPLFGWPIMGLLGDLSWHHPTNIFGRSQRCWYMNMTVYKYTNMNGSDLFSLALGFCHWLQCKSKQAEAFQKSSGLHYNSNNNKYSQNCVKSLLAKYPKRPLGTLTKT